jgi:ABC-type uncharacterized transport system permease subunit
MLLALLAHGFACTGSFADGIHFGFSLALSLMLWLAMLFYWIESLYARLRVCRPWPCLPRPSARCCRPSFPTSTC